MAFEAAGEAFERIGRRILPVSAIWDETQRHCERLIRYLDQQQAAVSVERVVLPQAGADLDRPLGVSLDGGKMNIRGEGWKEFKAGAIFDVVAPVLATRNIRANLHHNLLGRALTAT